MNGFRLRRIYQWLFLGLVGMLLGACAVEKPQPFALRDNKSFQFNIGGQLPIVSATSLGGRNVPFLSNRKKLIMIYAAYCDHCKTALKALSDSAIFSKKDLDAIVLEIPATKDRIAPSEIPKNKNIYVLSIPKTVDWSQANISAVPTFFTVSQDGSIANKYVGWHADDDKKFSWESSKK